MCNASRRGPRPVYFLKDGTPLIDAIAASGLKPITVYSRIRRGVSPDDAVSPDFRRQGRVPVNFLKDGSPLADGIRKAGVCKRTVYHRLREGLSPDDALSSVGLPRRASYSRRSVGTGRPVRPG